MSDIKNLVAEHYLDFPFNCEDENPSISIDTLISKYIEQQKETSRDLSEIHRRQFFFEISNFDCFTYRAMNSSHSKVTYWNSLEQSFSSFLTDNTVIYQTDSPYPTKDMILKFCHRFEE